jgi:hypothetical protein
MMTAAAVLCSAFLTGAGAMAAGTGAPATARAAAASGTWGTAAEVPGSNMLNKGGQDGIGSVSCAAAGDCVAGGSYTAGFHGNSPVVQVFVASQTHGKWGRSEEVPGIAALNTSGKAKINSVSCPAVGDCTAGGSYGDGPDHQQAFIVSETGGTWGSAEEVPGTAALDTGSPGAAVVSVSCPAAGDCTAGGYYSDSAGHEQAFVVSETGGIWGAAAEVPGSAALNAAGYAQINSVSCPAVGDCSAGGYYATSSTDGIPVVQALVVSETGGIWGKAKKVPGTGTLNHGGYATINSVSCASAGNCSAGGEYTDSTPATQAFVVNETGGIWGTAAEVPGIAALNQRKLAQINSVSCAAPGDCSAGGFYQDASFNNQAFVVNQTGGTWGTAEEVPGTAALNTGTPGAATASVSCAPAAVGSCSAGGYYSNASNIQQAFVVSETGGTWGTAEEVPGTAALNAGTKGAATASVSCTSAVNCTAGGQYTNANSAVEVFVVSET